MHLLLPPQEHRAKHSRLGIGVAYFPDAIAIHCGVARKVSKNEWQQEPEGVTTMDKEWNQLRNLKHPDPKDKGIGAWDEDSVRELGCVKDEARRTGVQIHDGRIAELCTQNYSELPVGHIAKIYKGRIVLLDDRVWGE